MALSKNCWNDVTEPYRQHNSLKDYDTVASFGDLKKEEMGINWALTLQLKDLWLSPATLILLLPTLLYFAIWMTQVITNKTSDKPSSKRMNQTNEVLDLSTKMKAALYLESCIRPEVNLSSKDLAPPMASWKHTLIGRICCNKFITSIAAKKDIITKWPLKEDVELIRHPAMPNTYLFKFSNEMDFSKIKKKSPWLIHGWVVVFKQCPFQGLPPKAVVVIEETNFWVTLIKVPASYLTKKALQDIMVYAGEIVDADQRYGTYYNDKEENVRLLVRVNVTKPLPIEAKIKVDGKPTKVVIKFIYDIVPWYICEVCRIIDHPKTLCGNELKITTDSDMVAALNEDPNLNQITQNFQDTTLLLESNKDTDISNFAFSSEAGNFDTNKTTSNQWEAGTSSDMQTQLYTPMPPIPQPICFTSGPFPMNTPLYNENLQKFPDFTSLLNFDNSKDLNFAGTTGNYPQVITKNPILPEIYIPTQAPAPTFIPTPPDRLPQKPLEVVEINSFEQAKVSTAESIVEQITKRKNLDQEANSSKRKRTRKTEPSRFNLNQPILDEPNMGEKGDKDAASGKNCKEGSTGGENMENSKPNILPGDFLGHEITKKLGEKATNVKGDYVANRTVRNPSEAGQNEAEADKGQGISDQATSQVQELGQDKA